MWDYVKRVSELLLRFWWAVLAVIALVALIVGGLAAWINREPLTRWWHCKIATASGADASRCIRNEPINPDDPLPNAPFLGRQNQ